MKSYSFETRWLIDNTKRRINLNKVFKDIFCLINIKFYYLVCILDYYYSLIFSLNSFPTLQYWNGVPISIEANYILTILTMIWTNKITMRLHRQNKTYCTFLNNTVHYSLINLVNKELHRSFLFVFETLGNTQYITKTTFSRCHWLLQIFL